MAAVVKASVVQLESAPCPLGCPRDDRVVLVARDRLYGLPGEFQIVRCVTCGLLRTDPRPIADTMSLYYPHDYGPYVGTRIPGRGVSARSGWRRIARSLARRVFRFNETAVPSLAPGRMLEVGCASGAYLAAMAAEGWQVEGIEFSDGPAEHARQAGFAVQTASLETAAAPENAYDLIAGWMVIEHLHDPLRALRKLRTWARPGGWLCISVPNAAAAEFRVFGAAWYALQVPSHLYHFSPETLTALLERAGWAVERICHQRNLSNLIGSLGHWLEDRRALPFLYRRLQRLPDSPGRWPLFLYPAAWLLSLAGQTGRMTIWARKPAH